MRDKTLSELTKELIDELNNMTEDEFIEDLKNNGIDFDDLFYNPNDIVIGGVYRHFKGSLYKVLSIAIHSETYEPMVVYIALYGDYRTFVRPAYMWDEKVIDSDGNSVRRFTLVSK